MNEQQTDLMWSALIGIIAGIAFYHYIMRALLSFFRLPCPWWVAVLCCLSFTSASLQGTMLAKSLQKLAYNK